MEQGYGDLFAPWQMSLIKSLIKEFRYKYPWIKLDFEDLLQECVIHWYSAQAAFKPEKQVPLRSYMTKVIKNKLHDILEKQMAEKRKLDFLFDSLESPAFDEEINLEELISDGRLPLETEAAMRVDIGRVIKELSPFQEKLCQLLSQGYSIRDISRTLGKSKSTTHTEVKKVRGIFSDKGLEKYLD